MQPTAEPTIVPTAQPTAEPTPAPTVEPTREPVFAAEPKQEPASAMNQSPRMAYFGASNGVNAQKTLNIRVHGFGLTTHYDETILGVGLGGILHHWTIADTGVVKFATWGAQNIATPMIVAVNPGTTRVTGTYEWFGTKTYTYEITVTENSYDFRLSNDSSSNIEIYYTLNGASDTNLKKFGAGAVLQAYDRLFNKEGVLFFVNLPEGYTGASADGKTLIPEGGVQIKGSAFENKIFNHSNVAENKSWVNLPEENSMQPSQEGFEFIGWKVMPKGDVLMPGNDHKLSINAMWVDTDNTSVTYKLIAQWKTDTTPDTYAVGGLFGLYRMVDTIQFP